MKHLLLAFTATLVVAASAVAGSFPDISIADLKAAIAKKNVTVVDVNGTASYKDGHIPGAIDYVADKGDFAKKLPSDKNALIVAYCGSPQCGAYAQAAKAAQELGYTNVQHFKPGLSGWKAAGEPLSKVQ